MTKPIYIFTGFLDGGKSSVIKQTLNDQEFIGDSASLLVLFEEGDVEFDLSFQKEKKVIVYKPDSLSEFNKEKMRELNKAYDFERVIIEFNGLQKVEDLLKEGFIDGWELAEILAIFDGSVFMNQLNNMKTFTFDHVRYADVAIFNRSDDLDFRYVRNNLKAANARLQVVFELRDGSITNGIDESFFDLSQDPLRIEDNDYGLWYMDLLDHPAKYQGKRVELHIAYCQDMLNEENVVVMGRKAMVCCADDVATIGFPIVGVYKPDLVKEAYYQVIGVIEIVSDTQGNPAPIMRLEKIYPAALPEEELVYFS